MSNHKLLLKRRYQQARKDYASALLELYQHMRIHEMCFCGEVRGKCRACGALSVERIQEHPEYFDGSVTGEPPLDDLIIAYLEMLQAERDEFAGRAVKGEALDSLIAAFEEWKRLGSTEIKGRA
jgi:hypothetical protein